MNILEHKRFWNSFLSVALQKMCTKLHSKQSYLLHFTLNCSKTNMYNLFVFMFSREIVSHCCFDMHIFDYQRG